jgi:hypothetical protein
MFRELNHDIETLLGCLMWNGLDEDRHSSSPHTNSNYLFADHVNIYHSTLNPNPNNAFLTLNLRQDCHLCFGIFYISTSILA